jgi:uracil phosphoribosyltransferase
MKKPFENLIVVRHPKVLDELSVLRDENTTLDQFRASTARLMPALILEATRDLHTTPGTVKTRSGSMASTSRITQGLVVVEILRAAQSMVAPILALYPSARIGVLGIKRDEEHGCVPVPYYCNLPPNVDRDLILVVDPMLATGGSACDAITSVKKALGLTSSRLIKLVCVIAADEGVLKVQSKHPEVQIFAAACDPNLNAQKYIVPGLGDFGDMYFGTEPKR